jgi:hypothetical protein
VGLQRTCLVVSGVSALTRPPELYNTGLPEYGKIRRYPRLRLAFKAAETPFSQVPCMHALDGSNGTHNDLPMVRRDNRTQGQG